MIRIVQLQHTDGLRVIARVNEPVLELIMNVKSVYDLASLALQ